MDNPSDPITISDVRSSGFCVTGAKEWFGRHGLDFRKFLQEGISEEEFLATGDQYALDVVRRKKERLNRG